MQTAKQTTQLRVLHIVGDSRFGGAATIILGLCRTARGEGWQADVLTTDPTFQDAVMHDGFGLVDLDVIRRPIRPLWDLRGMLRLVWFLRKRRYHIVHTHTSKGGFVGRLAARLAGVPTVVHTAHGFAFHETSPASTRRFYSSLEFIASRWCDRVVSVSEFHRDWAIRLGMCSPTRIQAIPNGIAWPDRNPDIDIARLRSSLGADPDDLVILNVARLAADKGLEYLIEAAGMLPPRGRRILIAIAGDGPARHDLERLAASLGVTDRLIFLGFRQDVGGLLAASDMVVLPTLREGLSISLLEAMAAGKPIVTTSIGSQKEIAAHGEMASLVPPADSRSLTDAILRLAEDPGLRNSLGATARAVYERHYTEKRMLQSYRQLYLDLLREWSPVGTTCEGLAALPHQPKGGV